MRDCGAAGDGGLNCEHLPAKAKHQSLSAREYGTGNRTTSSGTIWFTLQSGHKVMLDADLAALYGVETRTLVQAVKRNLDRFPDDFMFQLSRQDLAILRSQSVISSSAHGGRRSVPYAFTEHGALMAATVLNSPRAVEMSLYVVRAFVQLRETLAAHKGLAAKLEELERKTEAMALRHDSLAAHARAQLKQVFDAIRRLMVPHEPQHRPIGFIVPDEKKRG